MSAAPGTYDNYLDKAPTPSSAAVYNRAGATGSGAAVAPMDDYLAVEGAAVSSTVPEDDYLGVSSALASVTLADSDDGENSDVSIDI